MKKPITKKKLAVLRTLGVRITQAEFAHSIHQFDPILAGDLNTEVMNYARANGLKYVDIPLKPALFFDPVKLLLGRTTHQSWVGPDRDILESVLKEIDLYEIYETFFFYSRYTADIARKFGKPLITETWVSYPKHPSKYLQPYSINVKTVMKATDFFIARSYSAVKYLKEFNIPDRKIEVIYQGLDLERFFPVKKGGSKKVKILFVGDLSSRKGLDDLLAVYPKLIKESGRKLELLVCGDGKLKEEVESMSEKLPVKYFGQVPNLKIPMIYQMADIFCGPSKTLYTFGIKRIDEEFGLVFQEALASGLPIVTNRCGGVPEVVGSDNFTNEEGDREALFNSLMSLIKDEKGRRQIGFRNRKRAEKLFNLEKQTAITEKEIKKRFF